MTPFQRAIVILTAVALVLGTFLGLAVIGHDANAYEDRIAALEKENNQLRNMLEIKKALDDNAARMAEWEKK